MAIGINDFDEGIDDSPFEEDFEQELENQEAEDNNFNQDDDSQIEEDLDFDESESFEDPNSDYVVEDDNSQNDDDFINTLLRSRGIKNPSQILWENEDGQQEFRNWNELSNIEKLNIIDSAGRQAEDGLDEDEIQLINAVRQSQLTPLEYIQYIQRSSIDNYIRNNQNQVHYDIDDYTDDELFISDLLSKTKDITEDEAVEALEKAKSNEVLFKKQINAIREEYKRIADEQYTESQAILQQQQQQQFYQFAQSIGNSIMNFKEFSGLELNMDEQDINYLYQFITGTDNAGNSWFGKALNNPDTVVQMAWFVLNGEKMIQDITNYYQKEITNVRKNSYEKGLKDAEKNKNQIVYRQKNKPNVKNTGKQVFDDLDEY